MVEATQSGSQLAAALLKAAKAFPAVVKNRVGQARGGKYKYADLSSILDAVTDPLAENGLVVTQLPTMTADGKFVLMTKLVHVSGEFEVSTYPLPLEATPQERGSALTYARRYAISAMLNIAADDDDDGAEAEGGHSGGQQGGKPKQYSVPPAEAPKKPEQKSTAPTWTGKVKLVEVIGKDAWRITGASGDVFYTRKADHAAVASTAQSNGSEIVVLHHKTTQGNRECDAVDPMSQKESK